MLQLMHLIALVCVGVAQKIQSRAIVVASCSERLSWLKRLSNATSIPTHNMTVYRKCPPFERRLSTVDVTWIQFHNDYAKESSAYLSYIVDNYDRLADRTLFLHGHSSSWHCPDTIGMAKNLNWSLEFASINTDYFQEVTESRAPWFGLQMRDKILPALDLHELALGSRCFKTLPAPGDPEKVWPVLFMRSYCCGQFLVSRERIQGRRKSSYQRLLHWVSSRTRSSWGAWDPFHNKTSYLPAFAMEYSWAFIFGEPCDSEPYPRGQCSIRSCTEGELDFELASPWQPSEEPGDLYYVRTSSV